MSGCAVVKLTERATLAWVAYATALACTVCVAFLVTTRFFWIPWFWPPELMASIVLGGAAAVLPGARACGLSAQRRGWALPLSASVGALLALATACGWELWFQAAISANRAIMWSAPHHLGTLVTLPLLVATQSAWFCPMFAAAETHRQRLALLAVVPFTATAAVLAAESLGLAFLPWRLGLS